MADSYRTLKVPCEGIYKEKMSKFLAFAAPVYSAAEAKDFIAIYKKKYFDARHVCWAYMIGASRADYQSTDDGEPSGTAGKPILGQINSYGLSNVVIVVVRYFGGIKLGTSGLIVAYREAAREAIEAGEIVEGHEMSELTVAFPYMAMNDVMKLAKQPGVRIVSQEFDNTCRLILRFRADDEPMMRSRVDGIDGATVQDDKAEG